MKSILMACVLLLTCGCATIAWQKVPALQYVDKPRKFSAVLPEGWMYLSGLPNFRATRDGYMLNEIAVDRVKFEDDLPGIKKHFKAGMLPDEIAQVIVDIYKARADVRKFELQGNEAVSVSGKEACMVRFRYQTQDGLWMRGARYGFIHDRVVYVILLEAAEQHYYNSVEAAFKGFMQSFHLND